MARASFGDIIRELKDAYKPPVRVTDEDGRHIADLVAFGLDSSIPTAWAADVASWRNKHSNRFATQFLATPENAENYLRTVAASEDQILFMIQSTTGERLGHFGFKRNADGVVELDNLIRSDQSATNQLVYYVELTLLFLIFSLSDVSSVQVMVLGSNKAAHGLHRLCGFKRTRKVRVKSIEKKGVVTFKEAAKDSVGDDTFVYLTLDQDTFKLGNLKWLSLRMR